jgi:hypothetical protein
MSHEPDHRQGNPNHPAPVGCDLRCMVRSNGVISVNPILLYMLRSWYRWFEVVPADFKPKNGVKK